MSQRRFEEHYTCWNDCKISGCPGHTASIDWDSVSDALLFDDGDGQSFGIQTPELHAFAKMLKKLLYRVEIKGALKPLFEKDEDDEPTEFHPVPPSKSIGTPLPFAEASHSKMRRKND